MMHQVDTIETHVRPGLYLLGNGRTLSGVSRHVAEGVVLVRPQRAVNRFTGDRRVDLERLRPIFWLYTLGGGSGLNFFLIESIPTRQRR